jgi:hypothetical protein
MVDLYGGASVCVVYLPGMQGTPWVDVSLAELAEGFRELLTVLAGERAIVLLGASTGNLLTLSVTAPNIARRIAIEPFFATENLWPFIENSRTRMASLPDAEDLRRYFWRYFGIGETEVENRDYRHLLANIRQPTDVIAGGMPLLPKRESEEWPSFLAAEDRETLRKTEFVTLHEGPPAAGHGYGSRPGEGRHLVNRLIYEAIRAAWRPA